MSTLLGPVAGTRRPRTDVAPGPPPGRPDASPVAASLRFAAFAALVLYGCQHWVRQVVPTPGAAAPQMATVIVVTAALLIACGRIAGRLQRRLAIVLLCLVAAAVALAAAGIPIRFLGWHNWGVARDGVREGLSSLPNLYVPYRGTEDWVRWVILAGAGLLGVVAAIVGFAPRRGRSGPRTVPTALLLAVLYGLPVIERNPTSPLLSGTGFAVLLALYLGADRMVAVHGARPRFLAAGGALLALAVAVLIAPRLDGATPWLDYRGLAGQIGERNTTAFDWNHTYAPLRWPRTGRELLRVRARHAAYWKAVGLQRFDGVRWVEQASDDGSTEDAAAAARHPEWSERIDVVVRALRSEQYLTAGSASHIDGSSVPPVPAPAGTYRTGGRALRAGDTYSDRVYAPRPTPAQLRAAGTDYPQAVTGVDLTMELPRSVGGPKPGRPFPNGIRQTTIIFPPFASQARLATLIPGIRNVVGGALLERSRYARTWALAQRLRRESSSPFDLVRRVRQRVQQGARYTEQPARQAIPLDAFLFDAKEGYCQQFSGAMALLLRMAGVPARIGSGFTSGSFDSQRGDYIVRDLDAHSWVEAYFPGIGWVTFDPTPSIAPPAAQTPGDGGSAPAGSEPRNDAPARADVAKAPPPPAAGSKGPVAGSGGQGPAPVLVVLALLLAAAAGGLGAWAWRGARARSSPVRELERALATSGRPAAPGLTLQALERSLSGAPAAAAYVRTLRLARYAGQPGEPSRQERAALRAALAAGGGPAGWARAWWALPPRRPRG